MALRERLSGTSSSVPDARRADRNSNSSRGSISSTGAMAGRPRVARITAKGSKLPRCQLTKHAGPVLDEPGVAVPVDDLDHLDQVGRDRSAASEASRRSSERGGGTRRCTSVRNARPLVGRPVASQTRARFAATSRRRSGEKRRHRSPAKSASGVDDPRGKGVDDGVGHARARCAAASDARSSSSPRRGVRPRAPRGHARGRHRSGARRAGTCTTGPGRPRGRLPSASAIDLGGAVQISPGSVVAQCTERQAARDEACRPAPGRRRPASSGRRSWPRAWPGRSAAWSPRRTARPARRRAGIRRRRRARGSRSSRSDAEDAAQVAPADEEMFCRARASREVVVEAPVGRVVGDDVQRLADGPSAPARSCPCRRCATVHSSTPLPSARASCEDLDVLDARPARAASSSPMSPMRIMSTRYFA